MEQREYNDEAPNERLASAERMFREMTAGVQDELPSNIEKMTATLNMARQHNKQLELYANNTSQLTSMALTDEMTTERSEGHEPLGHQSSRN